jgi:hypothetical protein
MATKLGGTDLEANQVQIVHCYYSLSIPIQEKINKKVFDEEKTQ